MSETETIDLRGKRIGILTGGGDSPGLNAAIRGATLTAIRKYGMSVLGFRDGFTGIFQGADGIIELTEERVQGILTQGGTILGTANRGNPFQMVLTDEEGHPRRNASGEVITKDRSTEAAARLKSLDLVGLICIGGDGTLRMSRDFFIQHNVPVIGVPKTIDFDLSGTEATFGFKTAVQVATDALDRLRTTADSHDRVIVLELMGRYAGWITLNAGVAGGAHVILIPEIPYDPEIVWRRVTGRFRRHKHFSLVVISEGARTLKGDYAVAEVRDHPDGLPILGGAGQRLRYQLEEISRREAAAIRKSGGNPPESPEIRTVVLGHIQRGGTPLGDDRIIATSCGSYAIDMVARGEIGYMSAWSFSGPKSVPLDEALAEHFVDSENDPLVKTARDIGVSFGI